MSPSTAQVSSEISDLWKVSNLLLFVKLFGFSE